ncbi:TPA: tail fiber domain-containing protein [Escherichia coli]|uniref:tail fiber domain-containing protein n=1 Tax=Escherichia coli TaxID=562 RepID=UPI000DA465E7|nr:tail fiber domain-containing protein [Escherichia coli]EFC4863927.1 tail fiber domain-containing protein [Escherichia coli]SQK17213.1 putative phage tail fiber protein [Escherichia coli]HAH3316941.1 tail fiber domain-containing protein [Escherichia coli]HCO9654710.1 tail fiber domain-containing protein [Escherichia coli]HCO9659736.1 tail fiber domain-containing protein [Escherichia coli]
MQSIQFKRTNVSGKKPTPEQLQVGEVAINLKDHVIFTKDRDHEVVQISVSPETHAALESKVDANKQELDSTIAVNDRNIHAKVDEIKQTTDSTIAANHAEINNKVDVIKRETDATIEANKNKAASDLAGVKAELSDTINANKNAAAVATQELDTRINKKVDDIKSRTDATIASNDKAINDKVDLIKTETDRTIAANKVYAENQLTDTYNNLTGVIAANKQEAADNVAALTRDVEAKNSAIHSKVDNNKSYTDSELARLESRIDAADGSSDGKYIKKHVNTYTDGYLLSKTANYFDDPSARNLDYFGAFRMNDLAGHIAMILHVPHPSGVNHARGFEFNYGSNPVPTVRTYGYDELGHLAYSHRMYHEGDKPSPSELNVYSKQEVDRMFQKTLDFGIESGWFKIATVYLPQQYGRSAKIRLVGGNGYNVGQTGQANIIELVLRSGNGNPVGVVFNAYMTIWYIDQKFCAIPTGGDSYDIYGSYSGHTGFVLAEYQTSPDVNLTLYDKPQFIGSQLPEAETKFDAYTITSFSTYRNHGTLNFGANSQGQYDIEHLNEQPTNAKKMLRRFRSCAPATIWHETVDDNSYRLATGYEDTNQELLLSAVTGLHVKRLTLDGGVGNAGIDIRRGPNEASHFNFMDYRTGQDVRNGWFGFGDGQTKDFIWWNDNGQNSINLIENGELHITGGKGQKIVMNSEVALSENARLAVKGGNYGLIFRNDGSDFHILTTGLGDSFGPWNTRRPFSYNFADGGLDLGGTETARCLHLGIDGSTRLEDNLFFKAGSRQSMDYMELVHWGASNIGRNNVLSLRDSKGFLAEFERKGDNTIQNTFFGRFKVNGDSNAITINAPTDSDAVYVKGTCNDVDNWYIGKGGAGNGLVFCSYRSNAAVHLTDNGEVLLAPQNTAIVNINRDRIHINGTQWVANQPHGWSNQWLSEAPIFVDFGTGVPNDTYMPIIKARSQIAGGYATKADFGIYRHGTDTWGDAVIRVGSAESGDSSHPNAIYTFQANGDFKAPAGLRAGVNLGVGTVPVWGGPSIAIGDNDTGLTWGGDGRINMFANGQHIASWGTMYQEHPGLWGTHGALWTEVDKAIISHGHLVQANDNYSTYVRDIYIRSDIRVKKDLVKFENASKTLSKINGYKYLQKRGTNEDGSERWEENAGLIAQEVQAILPELVEGDPDSENLLRLNYNGVIGLNTAAINEHTEEISLLKEENKLLRDRLAAIEAKLFG